MPATEHILAVPRTEAVFKAAANLIAPYSWVDHDGASSPHLGGPILAKAKGAKVLDVDGHQYVDFCCAGGALILGHADERVVVALNKAAARGYHLGTPSEGEVRLAELIVGRFPHVERLRFVRSPLEALCGAIDVAKRATGRSLTMVVGQPLPDAATGSRTVAVAYDDVHGWRRVFSESGPDLACVVLEPVACVGGVVFPKVGRLETLRTLCREHGTLMVFDETRSGFRVRPGARGCSTGITPDLTVFGAVIGGGLALAAFGGHKDLMRATAAKTRGLPNWSEPGNALAIAAGIATLHAMSDPGFFESLDKRAARLAQGLQQAAADTGATTHQARVGSMLSLSMGETPGAARGTRGEGSDEHVRFRRALLDRGILLGSGPQRHLFVSAAHTDSDIDRAIAAFRDAFESFRYE